ncbi:hypothetical protein NQ318_005721 [Aromia moschata]|uniref:Uncharacterized protein n=1 Tax=Aromia moschata TaxID=1265417 RepID=A0AAV8YRW0_9CUCU|nr:hypothetical protein NQ318_005721 [Aromia moschata]
MSGSEPFHQSTLINENRNRLRYDMRFKVSNFLMASNRDSPDDDGYKRFTEDIHNVSYGSNTSNPVDEMGSRSSLSRDDADVDHWEMNYHEAAIFLEEGENNEKFDCTPATLPRCLPTSSSTIRGTTVWTYSSP